MKKLLFTIHKKDFEIQAYRGTGPGGQHRNKTDSAVRIIHKASGAKGECTTNKSQHRNKRIALQRLTETAEFKIWISRMAYEITGGETIEEKVEKTMRSHNIKIETKKDGKWTEGSPE